MRIWSISHKKLSSKVREHVIFVINSCWNESIAKFQVIRAFLHTYSKKSTLRYFSIYADISRNQGIKTLTFKKASPFILIKHKSWVKYHVDNIFRFREPRFLSKYFCLQPFCSKDSVSLLFTYCALSPWGFLNLSLQITGKCIFD